MLGTHDAQRVQRSVFNPGGLPPPVDELGNTIGHAIG